LWPGWHGLGRLQRQALRLARLRSEATTLDLVEWAFPRVRPEDRTRRHWWNTRRAAEPYWERAGRVGRYLLWRPKSAPSVQQTDETPEGRLSQIKDLADLLVATSGIGKRMGSAESQNRPMKATMTPSLP